MPQFERKNAYVNGLKVFRSQYEDDAEVIRFSVKFDDLDLLITQLQDIKAKNQPAKIDITHKEQEGKFGTFRGGKIRAYAAETKKNTNAPTVDDIKNKRFK
jgi:hypothetical protein